MSHIQISEQLVNAIIMLPLFFISLAVHEFAHALSADKLGDFTPRSQGRLTLNPIKHLDLWGSLVLPLFSILSGFAFIGWAKPVQIQMYNLRNPRRDFALVSFFGPLSNIVLALVFGVLGNTFLPFFASHPDVFYYAKLVFTSGIYLNVFLAFFNLLPIPSLDGFHIISTLYPNRITEYLKSFSFAGIIVLFLLISTPLWGIFVKFVFQITRLIVFMTGI